MGVSSVQRSSETIGVNEVSRISAGSVMKGEIRSPYDIRIDGRFEGTIVSQAKVVAGEKAVIIGDVVCHNADFWGRIEGDFYVKDTLSLKETAVVDGDLHTRRLQVELGTSFNGHCTMITEEEFERMTTGQGVQEELKPQPFAAEEELPQEKTEAPRRPLEVEESPFSRSAQPLAGGTFSSFPEA